MFTVQRLFKVGHAIGIYDLKAASFPDAAISILHKIHYMYIYIQIDFK